MHAIEDQEVIEWGIRRKPLYERQRNAIIEMEEKKNEQQHSSGNTDKWSDQV